MISSKAEFNRFISSIENSSVDLARQTAKLDEEECLVCWIHKGFITYSTQTLDDERIEATYKLKDGKISKSILEESKEEVLGG